MIPLSLEQVAEVVGGELADLRDGRHEVRSVTIDSRQAGAGTLFVPLAGTRADGHAYIADAAGRGAAGYLLEAGRPHPGVPGGVVVDDPADALLGLGAWTRDTVDPVVVAVTGSNGKTTTKDLVAASVGPSLRTVANPGSYNNELGVPLTCCMLEADSEVLVTEIGARGIGHIAELASVVRPDVAVVTVVAASHLELLGDEDAVAVAKRELVESLGAEGVAILNADDPRVAAMGAAAPGRVVTYGLDEAADWRATDVSMDRQGRPRFTARGPKGEDVAVGVPVPGAHNVSNALAALAVADACGVAAADAAAALAAARISPWRMELAETAAGLTVINDAYNANPGSMDAALRTLAAIEVAGRRWAVLGHMAELGARAAAAHADAGRLCAELRLDGLVVIGEGAAGIRAGAEAAGFGGELLEAADADEAARRIAERLGEGDAVLVKASRSAGLERVALRLTEGQIR